MPLFLEEHLIKDEHWHIYCRYRLHSKKPLNIEEALALDIKCPKCGGRLKQIGRCLNSHELGLYRCPSCDKWKNGGY